LNVNQLIYLAFRKPCGRSPLRDWQENNIPVDGSGWVDGWMGGYFYFERAP